MIRAVALILFVAALLPTRAAAVAIVQHRLAHSAEAMFGWPGGLLIAEGSVTSSVTAGPSFRVQQRYPTLGVSHIALGPNGTPWLLSSVVEQGPAGQQIFYPVLLEVTPTTTVLKFKFPEPGVPPLSFVTGPENAIWMVRGDIIRYTPGGGLTIFHLPTGGTAISIAATQSGLWFTDIHGYIGHVSPDGEITEHLIEDGDTEFGAWGFMEPYGITVGPDGALWFAEQNNGRIGRMTPNWELEEFAIPSDKHLPPGWAGAPAPRFLVSGPDNAVWFTDPGDGSVGRVSMAGEIHEYPVPGGEETVPNEITVGPEGNILFTEEDSPQIGSVDPNANQSASTSSSKPRAHLVSQGKQTVRKGSGCQRTRRSRGSVRRRRTHSGCTLRRTSR